MPRDTLSELTDVVIRMKEAFETKNISAFKSVFARKLAINVMGRFLGEEEFLSRLKEFFSKVEQPTLEIIRIEETDVKKTSAFMSYATEFSFIDEPAWEEHTLSGLLSLILIREKETQKAGRKDHWLIEGLTFARFPDRKGGAEEPPGVGAAAGPREAAGLFDGLFGLWY